MPAMSTPWHLYVLECADGTLYAGVTTDLDRRLAEHNGGPRGARYTRARRPVVLRHSWPLPDRSTATQAEAAFKRLGRANKLAVLAGTVAVPWARPAELKEP